jgi:hypothetical protein
MASSRGGAAVLEPVLFGLLGIWAFVLIIVISLCRAAAEGDHAMERDLELPAQERVAEEVAYYRRIRQRRYGPVVVFDELVFDELGFDEPEFEDRQPASVAPRAQLR